MVLKSFFPQTAIASLRSLIEPIYRQWLATHREAYEQQRLVNMHSLTHPQYFRENPAERVALFRAIAPPSLTEAMTALAGDELYLHNTQLFFNPHDPQTQPYWHRDLQYSPIEDAAQAQEQAHWMPLHVRIPLLPEQGIALIPQTHRRWDTDLEHNVRFERQGHRNSEDLPGAVLIDLHPGDVLIFAAQMIHRGHYAQNPQRLALDLCVGTYHPWIAGTLDPANLPTAEEIAQLPNPTWYARARQVLAQG